MSHPSLIAKLMPPLNRQRRQTATCPAFLLRQGAKNLTVGYKSQNPSSLGARYVAVVQLVPEHVPHAAQVEVHQRVKVTPNSDKPLRN